VREVAAEIGRRLSGPLTVKDLFVDEVMKQAAEALDRVAQGS
jgi:hypothetical protein